MYTYVSNVFDLSAAIGLLLFLGESMCVFVCVCVHPEAINN